MNVDKIKEVKAVYTNKINIDKNIGIKKKPFFTKIMKKLKTKS